MSVKTVIVLGAGHRGARAYGHYIKNNPHQFKVVGVAEPNQDRKERFIREHGIEIRNSANSWETLLARNKFADAVIVATQDDMHYAPAMQAMKTGYHVLIEKPMSPSPRECVALADQADAHERVLMVCHVLRYTGFFAAVKTLLAGKAIGKVVSIQHNENIGYWHMAHSYVRGNWRRADQSSPIILAKSCHDLDILLWLADSDCTRISSFGSLSYFRPENAPSGATQRCLEGCGLVDECPYSAKKIYLGANTDWPVSVISPYPELEARREALRTGPYGRCVFHCDNDVVDHQVVAIEFKNGTTASFNLCGLTHSMSRTLKIMGSSGEIRGNFETGEIAVHKFGSDQVVLHYPQTFSSGHGGGDSGVMQAFHSVLESEGSRAALTSARASVQSHLMAFAAEESRKTGTVVSLEEYARSLALNWSL